MNSKMQFLLAMLFLVFFSSACTSTMGRKIDISGTTQIRSGVTTKEDVLSTLGQPYSRNIAPDGKETWLYLYSAATATPGMSALFLGMFGQGSVSKETQQIAISFSGNTVSTCRTTVSSGGASGQMLTAGMEASQAGVTTETTCGDNPRTGAK
ncbi:MAG: outer membrane protein assembly factor BamE [Sulfuricellaceae bacterium]|nr:outer membrane protein assembly factor BamE [Sulfuricellaceae bacterium]